MWESGLGLKLKITSNTCLFSELHVLQSQQRFRTGRHFRLKAGIVFDLHLLFFFFIAPSLSLPEINRLTNIAEQLGYTVDPRPAPVDATCVEEVHKLL